MVSWYNIRMESNNKSLPVVGSTEYVEIAGIKDIPAKVDTGADSSSVWASHIRINKEGVLRFRLFDEGSPFYTGKAFKRTDYKVAVVRNSSGHEQIRYRTHLRMKINGHTIKVLFSLSNRSNNNFPVLIGRRTIAGKFFVDVSQNHTPMPAKNPKTKIVQRRLKENPHKFHLKYVKKLSGNVDSIKLKQKGAK